MNPVDLIGLVLLGVLVIGAMLAFATAQQRLEDPDDSTVVHLHQLPEIVALHPIGSY